MHAAVASLAPLRAAQHSTTSCHKRWGLIR